MIVHSEGSQTRYLFSTAVGAQCMSSTGWVQARGGELPWKSLDKHLLAPLNAHLALMFTEGPAANNPTGVGTVRLDSPRV